MNYISRTVLLLSLVSLLADLASEMLYPVMPVYLRSVGFSIFFIGLLEGVASFTAGLTRGYFGKRSDEIGLRLPFVRLGYLLSALSKPAMALAAQPLWVFAVRTADRLGKGLRSAPRDALLAEASTPATRARVFGFHRALDTFGAALGPVAALVLLHFFPGNYPLLFLLAGAPGLLSVLLLLFLRERKQPRSTLNRGHFFSYFRYWSAAPRSFRRLVAPLLLFALFNFSDVFLLLQAREITGNDTHTIALYIGYNLVFALVSLPAGMLADRFGPRPVMVSGLLLFALVYALFGFASGLPALMAAFTLYGMYAAATEGVEKAWISRIAEGSDTGTALGFYASAQSTALFSASLLAGAVWTALGPKAAFLLSAAVAVIAAALLAGRREKALS